MKQVFIINENHPKLLLFFAGWAADETPFKQYRPKGMDYMICYDYRTLDFDTSILSRYQDVNVVAWSMGVWAAHIVLHDVSKKNIFSFAFNGTTNPIDDIEGIPPKTYQDTLNGLTPASLQKFLHRMCNDSNAYKEFMKITPRRDFDEIKEELERIQEISREVRGETMDEDGNYYLTDEAYEQYEDTYGYEYDYVLIGDSDHIFPLENMLLHNGDTENLVVIANCAHYDESIFRFLLQDLWSMPIDDFTRYLKAKESDNY